MGNNPGAGQGRSGSISDNWQYRCEHPERETSWLRNWCEVFFAEVFAKKRSKDLVKTWKGAPSKPDKLNGKQMEKVEKRCEKMKKTYEPQFNNKIECMKGWGPTLIYRFLIKPSSIAQANKHSANQTGIARSRLATDSASAASAIFVGILLLLSVIFLGLFSYFYFTASQKDSGQKAKASSMNKSTSKSRGRSKSSKSKRTRVSGSRKSKRGKRGNSKSSKKSRGNRTKK